MSASPLPHASESSTPAAIVPRPTFRETRALIRSDLRARCDYENKRLTGLQFAKFLANPAALATIVYRLQKWLHGRRWYVLASLLRMFNTMLMSVEIDSSADIGPGLFLMHASYICIGPRVTIGSHCILAHQNSIAPSPFYEAGRADRPGGPILGDHVMMGAGACVSGEVVIGDRVRIAMNAAVDQSFPDDAVLFGVPARMTSKPAPSES